jgi:hypothetical protein
MAGGERQSRKTNVAGRDYWSKVDKVFGSGSGNRASVSHRAGSNKLTKRYTHKSIR